MAQKFFVPVTIKDLSTSGSDAITVFVDEDTYARLKVEAGGRLTWGSGAAAGDVNLYRDSADVLKTDDKFVAGKELASAHSSGDEGGEIQLAIPQTNTTISTGVAIDVYQNKLRIYETGGSNRGAYIDLTAASNGVASNLLAGGGGATDLDDLTDVVITSPEEFQGLSYNGTSWVNGHIPVVTYVRNAESTTLTTGTAVYLFGATGDHASVKRADNDSDTTSSKVIGLVAANIAASQNGPVVTRGYVDGIDLSVGYTAGDILWLGEDGGFTTTKPSAPEHLVFLGVVVRATNNGIIYVATQNGYELEELHDVDINPGTLASGDFLKYNGTLWVNDPINLGTDTTGDYVASLVAGNGITLSNNSGEGATPTINAGATVSDSAPSSPTTGQIWYESDTGSTFIYTGSVWVEVVAGDSGIVLVKTQTIGSAVSSVTVSDVFSSTYDSYKIVVTGGTASGTINMRMQLGSSTTGYYDALSWVQTNATTTAKADGADNTNAYWDRIGLADTNGMQCSIEIDSPGLAKYTTATARYAFVAGGDGYLGTTTAIHAVATAYTGFTLSLNSGTMTGGTIRVYGYRN